MTSMFIKLALPFKNIYRENVGTEFQQNSPQHLIKHLTKLNYF